MKTITIIFLTVLTMAVFLTSCTKEIEKEVISESRILVHEFTEDVLDCLADKIANKVTDRLNQRTTLDIKV